MCIRDSIWTVDGGYDRIVELDQNGKIVGAFGEPGHKLSLIHIFTIPIWLALIVEGIGAAYYETPLRTGRLRNAIVMGTATVAAISPLLWTVAALLGFSGARESIFPRSWKRVIWLLLTLAFLSTMFSCVWSCAGHPTWIKGYDG